MNRIFWVKACVEDTLERRLWFDKLTMSGIGDIRTDPRRSAMNADAKWVRMRSIASRSRVPGLSLRGVQRRGNLAG